MTSHVVYPAQPSRTTRTRGPIVASIDGRTGLLHRCGHFVPGIVASAPGLKVREALDPICPCPVCYPGGARFHQQTLALAHFSPKAAK